MSSRIIVFIIAALLLMAFAAESRLRSEVCISSMVVDTSTTITVPEECL